MYEPFDPGVTIRQYQKLYRVDGKRYDRLSSILACYPHPGLENWQRKKGFERADYERDRAATFGKIGHEIVEYINKGEEVGNRIGEVIEKYDPENVYEFTPEVFYPYADTYWEWFKANVKRVLFCEQTVWSPSMGWAGTDDTVYLSYDDKIIIADNKFSKNLSAQYRLQTVAYGDAFLELGWLERYDERLIIHMPWNGGGLMRPPKPYDDRERDRQVFYALLDVFRHEKAHENDWKK